MLVEEMTTTERLSAGLDHLTRVKADTWGRIATLDLLAPILTQRARAEGRALDVELAKTRLDREAWHTLYCDLEQLELVLIDALAGLEGERP